MAVAYVSTTTGKVTSTTLSTPVTVAAGTDFLLVLLNIRSTATVSSLSWNGNVQGAAYDSVIGAGAGTARRQIYIWGITGVSAGTFNLDVTISASAQFIINAVAFSGVDQSTPLGTAAKDSQVASASVSVAPAAAANDVVFFGLCCGDSIADMSPAGSESVAYEETQTSCDAAGYYLPGAAPTVTIGASIATPTAGIDEVGIGVAIKAAAAGGGGKPFYYYQQMYRRAA